jgi:hypothetical protein
MRITTYLQSKENREFIINACQRSRSYKNKYLGGEEEEGSFSSFKELENLYMPPAPVLVYILRRSAVVVVALSLQLYNSS